MRIQPERIIAVIDSTSRHAEVIHQADQWARLTDAAVEVRMFPSLGAASPLFASAGDDVLFVMPHPTTGSLYERVGVGVLRRTRAPVLFAKRSASTQQIVAATDLSDPALPAIRSAWQVARSRGARLTTLHCTRSWRDALFTAVPLTPFDAPSPAPAMPSGVASAQEALRRAHGTLGIGEGADPIVVEGSPVASIIDVAIARRAELLVLGSHHRSGLQRFFLGSVSEEVARRAPCSCLIVPLAGVTGGPRVSPS